MTGVPLLIPSRRSPVSERGACRCCLVCKATDQLVDHHVVGRTVAPPAVVPLCRSCHEQLHAGNPRLWRGRPDDLGHIETSRRAVLRLAEIVELLLAESDDEEGLPRAVVHALDAIGELLLAAGAATRRELIDRLWKFLVSRGV